MSGYWTSALKYISTLTILLRHRLFKFTYLIIIISATTIHYPRFNGQSFLEIPAILLNNTNNNDTIRIIFHTVHPDGLLLYSFNKIHSDHIELYIKDGRLAVSVSTGDGSDVVTMTTQQRVDSGSTLSAFLGWVVIHEVRQNFWRSIKSLSYFLI